MTPLQYITQNKIIIGECYGFKSIGYLKDHVVVGIFKNKYGEWSIRFADRSYHPMVFRWDRIFFKEPPAIETLYVEIDDRKEPNANYYKLKERHRVLCNKKLEINRTGRNTTMRNAYINQELEGIRDELRMYKRVQDSQG